MKKIIYGWLVFLTLPLTVIGYDAIVASIKVSQTTEILLSCFAFVVVGFQFIMTASLIVSGWKDLKIETPFQ